VAFAVSGGEDVTWLRPPARDDARGGAAAPAAEGRDARRDRALVRAAQRGDDTAMAALFRAHWGMAHRAAYLVVHDAGAAEDIAQEAFLSAVRALDRFDRRRPFGPWLHRIVVNRAIDHARARALRHEVAVAEPADMPAPQAAEPLDDVVATLATLPPDQRAVIVLRQLLEYTPGEIAGLLDLPRGTVNSRLRRGLDALAAGRSRPGGPERPVEEGSS
jgi:RNA polymerase sigma-70 factor, ECF subfamily